MQEVSGVTNLQTELNYLDVQSILIEFFLFRFPQFWGGGADRWGVSGVTNISLYEFRSA